MLPVCATQFSGVAQTAILVKMYKELIILGFIAGVVAVSKEFGVRMDAATMHCFEFCDLLVTFAVLLYIANTAIAAGSMLLTQRHWDRHAMTPVSVVTQKMVDHLELRNGNLGPC